jgi:hypothetical protein
MGESALLELYKSGDANLGDTYSMGPPGGGVGAKS